MTYFSSDTNQVSNLDEEFIIFPNPVKNNSDIYIRNLNPNVEITLFNVIGNLIPISSSYNRESNLYKLSINSLASGIYFLKAGNKSKVLLINN